MRTLIYDVAVTLDGRICHEDGSWDGMVAEGEHVDEYLARLETYTTVVMGRRTYEAGYAHGLEPGKRAYPHMDHHIFSTTLELDPEGCEVEVVATDPVETVRRLKESDGGEIYLCGGGVLAGLLLAHRLIDRWIVKLNPTVFGQGMTAFGPEAPAVSWRLTRSKAYGSGVVLLEYDRPDFGTAAGGGP